MKTWRLLVVDDEPANLEIIAEFLSEEPFELELASDGESALARVALARRPFDAVLLDRMMPGIDGIEVLRRLKNDPRYALTPVIIQTAAAAPEQVRQGLAAGAYYYLVKPYRPEALLGIVWAALEDFQRERHITEAVERTTKTGAMLGNEYSFQTIEEAERLAVMLAAHCPVPQTVAMGLSELLINAVEHGNLGLSYADKARLKQEEGWRTELERRQSLPEYRDRKATVRMDRQGDDIRFTVTDQGEGFEWQRYLDFDPARAFDPNGRGIALARQLAFSQIEYRGLGNMVVATVRS